MDVNARRSHGEWTSSFPRPRRMVTGGRLMAFAFFCLISKPEALPAEEPATPAPAASVRLKDGSVINGKALSMADDKLTISTDFDGDVVIDRSHILELLSELRLRLVLDDERVLEGTVAPGPEDNTLLVRTVDAAQPLPVPFSAVTAINPPEERPVRFKGNANAGLTVQDGNTRGKSAYANGELIVESGDHRGTLRGSYLYSEDADGSVSSRNGRASAKYDYFVMERLYLYGSGSLESDSEKDLELRTILSAGPGYQLIKEGDFEDENFRKLVSSLELGVSYIKEDFQDGTKDEFVAGRWAFALDWEFLPDRVGFFHRHEGHPNFEDFDDLLIISEQGLRFTVVAGLVATAQINWTWDNVPAAGADRVDTVYLLTLGYKFDV